MLESNKTFFVLVLSLLLVLSIFPIYSKFTHPLGNSDLLQTSVYSAVHLPTLSHRVSALSLTTAPTVWNTLPKHIRLSQSAPSFRSALKTHIFATYGTDRFTDWLINQLIDWLCVCVLRACACVCMYVCVCVCTCECVQWAGYIWLDAIETLVHCVL